MAMDEGGEEGELEAMRAKLEAERDKVRDVDGISAYVQQGKGYIPTLSWGSVLMDGWMDGRTDKPILPRVLQDIVPVGAR